MTAASSLTVNDIIDWLRANEVNWATTLDSVRGEAYLAKEAGAQMNAGSIKLVQQLGLSVNGTETFADIIGLVVSKFQTAVQEGDSRLLSSTQKVLSLEKQISDLTSERENAIARLVAALELPGNRNRTIEDVIREVVEIVNDAKRMVAENL